MPSVRTREEAVMRSDALDLRARISADEAIRICGLTDRARRLGPGRWMVCCPAHDDGTPSCSVRDADDGTVAVRCFGCELAGDIFHLVAAVEGLNITADFPAVLRRTADLAGHDLDASADKRPPPPPRPHVPAGPPPLADERFAAIVAPILYCGSLDADNSGAADVVRYLAGRGLLEAARADGWAALPPIACQGTWARALWDAADENFDGYQPPFTRDDLDRAGLLGRDGFVHPEARLCIPWRDPSGIVVGLQRRRLDHGEPKYVHPRGRPQRWPFGVERSEGIPFDVPLVFVEGAVDVLALRSLLAERGEAAIVVGLPGLTWRAGWAQLASGRVAGVGIDTDAAGEAKVRNIADDLAAAGAVRVERWTPPTGCKDWGDAWAARVMPPKKEAA
jgi:DNA primase